MANGTLDPYAYMRSFSDPYSTASTYEDLGYKPTEEFLTTKDPATGLTYEELIPEYDPYAEELLRTQFQQGAREGYTSSVSDLAGITSQARMRTGQTGFALTEGTTYLCYHNGTDIINTGLGALTTPEGSNTYVQYNNSGAFGGDANLAWVAADGLTIDSEKELRLGDNTGAEYVGIKAPAAISPSAYTLTMPAATGAADEVLSTNGSGVLSWVAMAGGTSWQTVITAATKTAVAGEGYFIDTTSNACNLTLPAGNLGDEVAVIDYAGTFDTNNLTVTPGSGEKIQGNTADATLTVATERAGFTLAYSGATQGWLLKNN